MLPLLMSLLLACKEINPETYALPASVANWRQDDALVEAVGKLGPERSAEAANWLDAQAASERAGTGSSVAPGMVVGQIPEAVRQEAARLEAEAKAARVPNAEKFEPDACSSVPSQDGALQEYCSAIDWARCEFERYRSPIAESELATATLAYRTTCSTCHGDSGRGDGVVAGALVPRPTDFTSAEFWKTATDQNLLLAIRDGGPAVGKSALMAGWGGTYSDAEIHRLIELIKTMQPPRPRCPADIEEKRRPPT